MVTRSTKPTVELWLREVNASPGGSVSLDALAKLAQQGVEGSHFRSCVEAYRKALETQKGIRTAKVAGSLHFLTLVQATAAGFRDVIGIERKADRNAGRIERTVDPRVADSDQDRAQANLLRRAAHDQLVANRNVLKSIPAHEDVKPSPRLRVVNGEDESKK